MNSDKLKSIISKKSNGNSDISQKYFQLFYFEKILERISLSKYKNHIILKGGLLLTSIIGSDDRTTKDMDATLKGIPLTTNDIKKILTEIFKINIKDHVKFQIISIKKIMQDNTYEGYRINILSTLDKNKTYISVELTTGDIITPKEIKYSYNSIFENKKIPIISYTIETILAEKFHSFVTKGILNTRVKDFYDMYILINKKNNLIKHNVLTKAIQNTFKKRETNININYIEELANYLENDDNMHKLWKEYTKKNNYVKNITFEDTIKAVKKIITILKEELLTLNK